jgi:hypothetical protein
MNLIVHMRMLAVSISNTTSFRKDSKESQWLAEQARAEVALNLVVSPAAAQRSLLSKPLSLFFFVLFETVYKRSAELKLI